MMASVRKRSWRTSKGDIRQAWCCDFVDAAGTRQRKHFPTKRAADAFRVEIETQLKAGSYRPDAANVTVKDVAAIFLDHYRGRMERRERVTRHHLSVCGGHFRNHILHPERGIGAVKLAQLTSRAVCDLRDRLRNAGVSVPTTRKVLGTLHTMLEYATSRDLIAVNAARGVKVIGRRDEGAKKIVPPSKQDLRKLMDAADDDFRLVLLFAAATGVRAGELHALRWRHLDLDHGEVSIECRVDCYGHEDTTKTTAGLRKMPLSLQLAQQLKAWRLRSRFSTDDDLVFPSRRGSYDEHANMVKRRFKPLFEQAGVEPFNWHALRHFAVSCWIESGLSPKTIQTFAGHSSLQVTMDRYGHLFPSEDHQRVMDEVAKRIFS